MSDIDQIFDLANLRRAYRWLLSNSDARYKAFFRDSYAAFALSSDTFLKQLRRDGLSHRYIPNHASKVMVPKPSGTLRPLTLLSVEDQLVYQASVNIISDLLKPKTKHRYRKRVYSHLYAGKSSPFFYMRWQDSYRSFARAIRDLHSNGFIYVANFDLAAFYDSIDHHVLSHFLKEVGLDEDAIALLMHCLRQWTSSTWSVGPTTIYHEHGIPQGPLSSGMLSEVVLQHIDKAGERGRKTRYLRYVDDIKIFARSEDELRRKPYGDVSGAAKFILRNAGVIKSVGRPASMINGILAYALKRAETSFDWIKLLGPNHKHTEQMAIFLKQSLETDIDAFITRFDSFADKLIEIVFLRHCPGKKYPNYGSALKHPVLAALLPAAIKSFEDLHSLRLESVTAHPRSLKTGVGTRRLKHRDYYKIRPALVLAFDEFESQVVP